MYNSVFIIMCLSGVASSQTQHLCNCYCNNPQKGQKNECFLSINKERCCHVSYMQNRVHNPILIKVQMTVFSFANSKFLGSVQPILSYKAMPKRWLTIYIVMSFVKVSLNAKYITFEERIGCRENDLEEPSDFLGMYFFIIQTTCLQSFHELLS